MIEFIGSLPSFVRVLLLLVGLVALANVAFYLFLMVASGCKRREAGPASQTSVAVLLRSGFCRDGLAEDVDRFLGQAYERYCVVVVDETGEGDGTPMLDALRHRHSNLYVTAIPNDAKFTNLAKLSLTVGIKATDAQWIVQADRSCPPVSEHWLAELSRHFHAGVNVVLAYNRLEARKGGAAHIALARYRWRALVRLAYARGAGPYLGEASNLAYRREAFIEARGFAGANHLLGGEGELIAHRLSQVGSVRAEVGFKAQTRGELAITWRDYFRHIVGEKEAMCTLPFAVRSSMQRNAVLRMLTWLFGLALLPCGEGLLWAGIGVIGLRRLLYLLCGVSGMVRHSERWNLLWMWLQDIVSPFVWVVEARKYREFKRQPQWRR